MNVKLVLFYAFVAIIQRTRVCNGQENKFRLSNATYPYHYDLSIVINDLETDWHFNGIVAIHFKVITESRYIRINAEEIDILAITLIENIDTKFKREIELKSQLEYDSVNAVLKIETVGDVLKSTKNYVVTIRYSGSLAGTKGLYKTYYHNEKNEKIWLASTQFEATHARKAFPCYDEPEFKATFTISIDHQLNLKAISNMKDSSETELERRKMTKFHTSKKMSTYLIAIVVSDFKSLEDKQNNVLYRIFASAKDLSFTEYALNISKLVLPKLEEICDFRYPLEKLDQALVEGATKGMENWGLIIYGGDGLIYDDVEHSYIKKKTIGLTTSHEIAHQFFGNLVTPKWWDTLWLKEGYANFFGYFLTDLVLDKKFKQMDEFNFIVLQNSLKLDVSSNNNRPLTYSVDSAEEISAIFDFINYDKATSILNMYYHAFGEEWFFDGIRRLIYQYEYRTITPNDLFKVYQESYDKIFSDNLNIIESSLITWTTQRGYPVLMISMDAEKTIWIQQITFLDSDYKSYSIPINVITKSEAIKSNLMDYDKTSYDMWMGPVGDTKYNLVENMRAMNENDWFLVNKKQTGYFRTIYDESNLNLLTEELRTGNLSLIHHLNRAQLIDDLYHTVEHKYFGDYTHLFELLVYLKNEMELVPWMTANYVFEQVYGRIVHTDAENRFYVFMRSIISKIYSGLSIQYKEEEYQQFLFKSIIYKWACRSNYTGCPAMGASMIRTLRYTDYIEVCGFEYKLLVFEIGLVDGSLENFLIVWREMNKAKNFDNLKVRNSFIKILGGIQNPSLVREMLELTLSDATYFHGAEVLFDDVDRVTLINSITEFNYKLGPIIVLEFLTANAVEIIKRFNNDVDGILLTLCKKLNNDTLLESFKVLAKYYGNFGQAIVKQLADDEQWKNSHQTKINYWFRENVKDSPDDDGGAHHSGASLFLVFTLVILGFVQLCTKS